MDSLLKEEFDLRETWLRHALTWRTFSEIASIPTFARLPSKAVPKSLLVQHMLNRSRSVT